MKISQVSVDIWIICDVFKFVYLVLMELWRHLLEDMMTRTIYPAGGSTATIYTNV